MKIRLLLLRRVGSAALAGLLLSGSGCYLNHEARLKTIQREAADAEALADERLDLELDACGDDVDCRHAALERYGAAMREIQATRDARFDAWLEETR